MTASLRVADNTYDRSDNVWRALMRITMLCSRTEFKPGEESLSVLRRSVGTRIYTIDTLTASCLPWRFYGGKGSTAPDWAVFQVDLHFSYTTCSTQNPQSFEYDK